MITESFGLDIYPLAVIERAARDYSSIAMIKTKKKRQFVCVTMDKCLYDEKQTLNEFENYMIGLLNMDEKS